ncbi:hypothetical protein KKA49_03865 [Patescibacteria group bacterium]|nr:hypothetical protein [Patescibacteria group bacterium]
MKLRDEVGIRIKTKLDKLKSRIGHSKLISDVLFPSRKKEQDRQVVCLYTENLERKLTELEPLIKSLRYHIGFIGDQNKFVASYLLIGKAYSSLKAVVALARQGYSFQIVEIIRSSMESLGLVVFFLENGHEDVLKQWFSGKVISNKTARRVEGATVNQMNKDKGNKPLPVTEALTDIYSIYSSYTHSGYAAIFDFIDVFREDFDFKQSSQFHYDRKNIHLIDNLFVNVLLALKNFYIRVGDLENLAKVEALIKKEEKSFASPAQISQEFKRYNS